MNSPFLNSLFIGIGILSIIGGVVVLPYDPVSAVMLGFSGAVIAGISIASLIRGRLGRR